MIKSPPVSILLYTSRAPVCYDCPLMLTHNPSEVDRAGHHFANGKTELPEMVTGLM